MAATDGQITVAAARFTSPSPPPNTSSSNNNNNNENSNSAIYLHDFISTTTTATTKQRPLPAVIKIIKGSYASFGVPSLPSPSLQSTALLISAGRQKKIIAQAVKIKEGGGRGGRRLVSVGPRLAIPERYQGWFELLSEEGKSVKCIETVGEVVRRIGRLVEGGGGGGNQSGGFLVREAIRAIHIDGGGLIRRSGKTMPAGRCGAKLVVNGGEITLATLNGGGGGEAVRKAAARSKLVVNGAGGEVERKDSSGDVLLAVGGEVKSSSNSSSSRDDKLVLYMDEEGDGEVRRRRGGKPPVNGGEVTLTDGGGEVRKRGGGCGKLVVNGGEILLTDGGEEVRRRSGGGGGGSKPPFGGECVTVTDGRGRGNKPPPPPPHVPSGVTEASSMSKTTADDILRMTEGVQRTIPAGEVLHPLDIIPSISSSSISPPPTTTSHQPTSNHHRHHHHHHHHRAYLKCSDRHGNLILLPLDARGKFSIVAREDNISGVHTARNLLSKRMPLMVRLVHGAIATNITAARELRLLSIVEEECVFGVGLQKEGTIVGLPLDVPLKVLRCKNEDQLHSMPEFQRLLEKSIKLVADVADQIQVIHDASGKLKSSSSSSNSQEIMLPWKHKDENRAPPAPASAPQSQQPSPDVVMSSLPPWKQHQHHRVPSLSKEYEEIDQIYDYVRGFAPLPKTMMMADVKPHNLMTSSSMTDVKNGMAAGCVVKNGMTNSMTDVRNVAAADVKMRDVKMRDVKQQQQHHSIMMTGGGGIVKNHINNVMTSSSMTDVRNVNGNGGVKRVKNHMTASSIIDHANKTHDMQCHDVKMMTHTSDVRPIPPPIDTIPTITNSKKQQAEKRKTTPKQLYVKNHSGGSAGGHQSQRRNLLFRQKSSSPMKETTTTTTTTPSPSNNGSPLFNIRYKSLSNLEYLSGGGTLDSSNSGGGSKQPEEKRSRKLSRPRSLTNLVWELKECADMSIGKVVTTTAGGGGGGTMMVVENKPRKNKPDKKAASKYAKDYHNHKHHHQRSALYL